MSGFGKSAALAAAAAAVANGAHAALLAARAKVGHIQLFFWNGDAQVIGQVKLYRLARVA